MKNKILLSLFAIPLALFSTPKPVPKIKMPQDILLNMCPVYGTNYDYVDYMGHTQHVCIFGSGICYYLPCNGPTIPIKHLQAPQTAPLGINLTDDQSFIAIPNSESINLILFNHPLHFTESEDSLIVIQD